MSCDGVNLCDSNCSRTSSDKVSVLGNNYGNHGSFKSIMYYTGPIYRPSVGKWRRGSDNGWGSGRLFKKGRGV